MKIIQHYGKTVRTDLVLTISQRGFYFALGRLDCGINWPLSFWTWKYKRDLLHYQLIAGPVDIMWTRKVY